MGTRYAALVVTALLALAACGGGGGGGSSSSPATGQNPPPSSPALPNQPLPDVGAATLSWTPPTENSDGSPLVLSGYRILYGNSPTGLDQVIEVSNPSISTYVVENLSSGTWYFSVVAVSAQGVTSNPSNLASKVIG